jgi:hypothetical protein
MAGVNLLEDDDPYGFRGITTGGVNPSNSTPTGAPGSIDRQHATSPPSNSQPYTNWNDEFNWFKNTVTPHVTSQPFLYGKVKEPDVTKAFDTYNTYRQNPQFNRGDAYNRTLDDLGWWTGQVTSAPPSAPPSSGTTSGGSGPQGGNFQSWFSSLTGGRTPNSQSLMELEPELQKYGIKVLRNATGIAGKIQLPDGSIVDVGGKFSSGDQSRMRWQWMTGTGSGQPGGSGAPLPGMIPGVGAPGSQFTDPLTKQYEALLQQQTKLYQQQQQQMQMEAQRQQAVRAQTDEAVKRLLGYVDERVTKLGQPAYTDSEANIFQTRALDPLERDRTAANQRALQNIGSRGFDPSSGIAQELLLQVNRGFDQDRSATQNELAYKQIEEQRSRDQEKQKLLQYAAEAPQAAARGDLSFVQLLNDAINQPGQNAMATSNLLQQLPVQRTQLAMQALGLGGQPQSGLNGVLSLLQNSQQNRLVNQQQGSEFWRNIGASFF